MKVKDINQTSVRKISKPELLNMHSRMHQYDGIARTRKLKDDQKKIIIEKHNILVKEMKRRGINHNSPLKYVKYQIIKERYA